MATKKSTKSGDEHKYAVGDVVLAKVKGFPNWPGKLVSPETAPPRVAKDKGAGSHKFLVKFFPAGDYTWSASKDLAPLPKSDIEAFIADGGKKKSAMTGLLEGYKIALDPTDWEREQEKILNGRLEEEDLADDEDQLEDGEKGSKKRKRGSTKTQGEKKKKAEKNGKEKKEKHDSKKRPKGSKADSKEEDEEEDGATRTKNYRNKLQRSFLGKKDPKIEDMDDCGKLFTEIEQFEFQREWLRASKLGKVMKRISLMEEEKLPKNDKYDFKARAEKLVKKWHVDNGEVGEGDLTLVDGEKRENGDAKMDTSE